MSYWNSHLLRKNRNAACPNGIPDDLYDMPEEYGGMDYLQSVDHDLWVQAMIQYAQNAPAMFTDELYEECHQLVQNRFNLDLERDVTSTNAVEIYKYVVNNIS